MPVWIRSGPRMLRDGTSGRALERPNRLVSPPPWTTPWGGQMPRPVGTKAMPTNRLTRQDRLQALAGSAHSRGFEQLEPRVLLSGSETMDWFGGEVEVSSGSWIMTFDEYLGEQAEDEARSILERTGTAYESIDVLGRGKWVKVVAEDAFTDNQARVLAEHTRGLAAIEPDRIQGTYRIPNDPSFGEQYYHQNTGQFNPFTGFGTAGADIASVAAWDETIGSPDVVVAVIDTGLDMDHPDLVDNIYVNPFEIPNNGFDDDGNGFIDDVNGWDFGAGDNDPDDEAGHGTAVSGTIAAVGDNGIGIAGVGWNVKVIPLKIANDFGQLVTSAIIAAHEYATTMVLNGHNIVASNKLRPVCRGLLPGQWLPGRRGGDPGIRRHGDDIRRRGGQRRDRRHRRQQRRIPVVSAVLRHSADSRRCGD